ncbi:MAG: 30S ribosomal protein S6 [Desulfuromonadales bacterium]
MRTYETIFIVHPDAVGEQYAGIIEKFKKVLEDQQANVLKVEEWGARKLAYPVKKQSRGSYVLVAYEAEPQVIAEFERRLRLDETIIKFMTVHLEKGLPAVKEEPASMPAEEATESEDEETEEA